MGKSSRALVEMQAAESEEVSVATSSAFGMCSLQVKFELLAAWFIPLSLVDFNEVDLPTPCEGATAEPEEVSMAMSYTLGTCSSQLIVDLYLIPNLKLQSKPMEKS